MRKSNIELLRIVLIIMVIAHHYVVNSGIKAFFTPAKNVSKNDRDRNIRMWWKDCYLMAL